LPMGRTQQRWLAIKILFHVKNFIPLNARFA
jgi:hypothetical protein